MELWIRSQDKDSLIKAEKIELIYDYLCSKDIQLIHIETDKGRIGSYSKLERAKEVLDEIQKIINNGLAINNNNQFVGTTTCVYEMPKE